MIIIKLIMKLITVVLIKNNILRTVIKKWQ